MLHRLRALVCIALLGITKTKITPRREDSDILPSGPAEFLSMTAPDHFDFLLD